MTALQAARSVTRFLPAALLSLVATTASPAHAQGTATVSPTATPTPATRDDWQRAPEIFVALEARKGSRIADVGAGEGWLTTRLARHVGASGRVFAVDISENALRQLQRTLEAQELTNVELILGEEDDPRLPWGSLDGIVILNAYHEMPQRVALLTAFKRALRPGGMIVIVDNVPADSTAPRQRQMANHQLWLAHAEDDLISVGFEVVRREPAFVERRMNGMSHDQWLLVGRRGEK